MPAAPALAIILNPSPLVEAALQSRIAAIDKAIAAVIPRMGADLTGTRIEITLTLGHWAGGHCPKRNGRISTNCWTYTLSLALFTQRSSDGQPDAHAKVVSKLRQTVNLAVNDPTLLEYHTIASLHLRSGTEAVRTDQEFECSATVYQGVIVIRSDAWPLD